MPNSETVRYGFIADRILVVLAYSLAIFLAWISMQLYPGDELWIKIAIGDFVGTVIIFIASRVVNNSSMYDPYWSVIPIIMLIYMLVVREPALLDLRIILLTVVVAWWGMRLTHNWLRTWPGLNHEDWRYGKLAEDTGKFYWVVSFLGIHLFPTILVFLGCLPFIPIISSDSPILWTDFVGFLIALSAIVIERSADRQLRDFKISHKGEVCDQGLWNYSRHPNYFGEIMFWGGIFVMGYGIDPAENLLYGVGFLCMILLFVFVSIPMMEKRQLRKSGYVAYKKEVSMLIPWFRKR